MIDFLNRMFESKGLEFTRIIITNVTLPDEISGPLDEKAQYGSMNDFERTRHTFDIRCLNDNQELELYKVRKQYERAEVTQSFHKVYATHQRDLDITQQEAIKSVACIDETTETEKKRIDAESELQAQKIKAEIKIQESKMRAEGKLDARLIEVEANSYQQTHITSQESKVADKQAEITKIEGNAEVELKSVLALRRMYQYMNSKLGVIKAMGKNSQMAIFGSGQKDDAIAQIGALGLLRGSNSQPLLQINGGVGQ